MASRRPNRFEGVYPPYHGTRHCSPGVPQVRHGACSVLCPSRTSFELDPPSWLNPTVQVGNFPRAIWQPLI